MARKHSAQSAWQFSLQSMLWTVAGCAVVFAILRYTGFQAVAIGLAATVGAVAGNGIAWLRWKSRNRRSPTTDDSQRTTGFIDA